MGRPYLKSYVAFIGVNEGVYFEAGDESFLLKGRGLFAPVSRLLQLCDGEHETAVIEEQLPRTVAALYVKLIHELVSRGMAYIEEGHRPIITTDLTVRYGDVLAYLRDETPSWATEFLNWRQTPILAMGHGVSYRSFVSSLLECGAGTLTLRPDSLTAEESWALRHLVDEALENDAQIDIRLTTGAQDSPASFAGRIFHVSDSMEHCNGSLDALLSNPVPGMVIATEYRGAGVVGPETGEDGRSPLDVWEELSLPGAGRLPRACLAVLGAATGFEALKKCVYGKGNEQRACWPREHVIIVQPDATVSVHAARSSGTAQPGGNSGTPPYPSLEPLRRLSDPMTGLFSWDDPEGPEYPLPRLAAIRSDHPAAAALPARLNHWAITPQDLKIRLARLALQIILNPDKESSLNARSPLLVAADVNELTVDGIAWATIGRADFKEECCEFAVDLEKISSATARTLIRLIRLYCGTMPSVSILTRLRWPAYVIRASIGPEEAFFVSGDLERGVAECIGDLLSAAQAKLPVQRQIHICSLLSAVHLPLFAQNHSFLNMMHEGVDDDYSAMFILHRNDALGYNYENGLAAGRVEWQGSR